MTTPDPFRIDFDAAGHLVQQGRDGWREPVCPVCEQPIWWVLDMMSFVHGPGVTFQLAHARCAWRKSGFDAQRKLALGDED